MSNMANTSAKNNDRYYLEDQERWENLGFDWESWNATVRTILRKQTVMSSSETGTKPRTTISGNRITANSSRRSNWMG